MGWESRGGAEPGGSGSKLPKQPLAAFGGHAPVHLQRTSDIPALQEGVLSPGGCGQAWLVGNSPASAGV